MKKIIYFFIILLSLNQLKAQVSIITDQFSSMITNRDYSSDRKLFEVELNDKLTKNYVVVSKNKRGAENDILYIEKFTKNKKATFIKGFVKTFSIKFTHKTNLSLSFVRNRMMYKDIDKDGNVEFIYIIKEQENGVNSPLMKIIGLIMYKNKAYKLWVHAKESFKTTHFDENFKELPENVSSEFLEFWDKLKKE